MAGKFEVYEDKSGQWRFRLKAGNGEIVASGESYPTKEGARGAARPFTEPLTARRSKRFEPLTDAR